MTKAAGYVCVSTQRKVRDGYSLAYQRDEIMRNFMHIYEDNESAARRSMEMSDR